MKIEDYYKQIRVSNFGSKNFIEGIRKLFRLEKENEAFTDSLIRDIRNTLKHEKN